MDHAGSKDRPGSSASGLGPASVSLDGACRMKCDPIDADRINLFALVSYIPNPLGEFLDRLRKELVAGCNPHAHVTVLPPRPLYVDPQTSMRALETNLDRFSPFQVEIERVQVFK